MEPRGGGEIMVTDLAMRAIESGCNCVPFYDPNVWSQADASYYCVCPEDGALEKGNDEVMQQSTEHPKTTRRPRLGRKTATVEEPSETESDSSEVERHAIPRTPGDHAPRIAEWLLLVPAGLLSVPDGSQLGPAGLLLGPTGLLLGPTGSQLGPAGLLLGPTGLLLGPTGPQWD
ncbi:uncharacterized protein LOC144149753 [Haemaphysalis longicornis]